jgi:arylsulfatase A-like enzyme
MKNRSYSGLLLVLLAACSGTAHDGLPFHPHPIVLIDIGTLRADHLGCYGYQRDTSPNLDALASESVLFEWAFSQAPNTAPSQASIFTGLYPGTHGLISDEARLPAEAKTLAEALAERGYITAAFVDGGYLSSDFGFDQGFRLYDNSRGGGLAAIGPKAITWLEEHASDDFLLVVHTYDAHAPYSPPDSHRDLYLQEIAPSAEGPEAAEDIAYAKALYDAEIRFVDDWIGMIVQSLSALGLDERATIAVVADHGEEFMEHGSVSHETLYSTVTRVPMMVRLPGGMRAGTVSSIVETIDLMPTLLELSGVPQPAGIQGESLLPLIRGERQPPYLAFGESSFFGGQRFVAMDGYHMIMSVAGEGVELFNYLYDPLELDDLSADEPDRVEVLRRKLDSWEEMVARAAIGQEAAPLDEDTLEQLKSLGYVQ